jgi:hypothetical protein
MIPWYILCDNGTRRDHSTRADGHAFQNYGAKANPHVIFNRYVLIIERTLFLDVNHPDAYDSSIVITGNNSYLRSKHHTTANPDLRLARKEVAPRANIHIVANGDVAAWFKDTVCPNGHPLTGMSKANRCSASLQNHCSTSQPANQHRKGIHREGQGSLNQSIHPCRASPPSPLDAVKGD